MDGVEAWETREGAKSEKMGPASPGGLCMGPILQSLGGQRSDRGWIRADDQTRSKNGGPASVAWVPISLACSLSPSLTSLLNLTNHF